MEIRDQRNCSWYWMDKVVYLKYAKDLGTTAIAVYCALCVYSNGNKCWPAMNTIAEKLGVSRKSVSIALDTLEKASLIKIESGAATGNPNIYTLLNICEGETNQIQGYDNLDALAGQVRPTRVGHYGHTNDNTRTIIKNNSGESPKNPKTTNELPPECSFATAYAAYPRKLGRANAEIHFNAQVKTKKDYDDLILAIENYATDCIVRETEEQYIKHASSFFNKNWRDWIDRKPTAKPAVQRYSAL